MTHKASTLDMMWANGKRELQGHNRLMVLVLIGVAIALAAGSSFALVSAVRLEASSRLAAGVEADAARWAALGAAYTPDYEAIAMVSSVRWSALGETFSGTRARAADAARWAGRGAAHAPDYETIAAVSAARWAALGGWYVAQAAQGH